jgi:hypothetical protein
MSSAAAPRLGGQGQRTDEEMGMGKIAIHEFVSLDGVFEDPRWTADYGFDPKMGEAIGALTSGATGILLGRRT